MKIAIGTERRAKVEAVRAATISIAALGIPGWETIELVTRSVESGAPATPTSDREMMFGARTRVLNLIRLLSVEKPGPDLFLGLEGGLHVEHDGSRGRRVFLRGWVYATSGPSDEGRFGATPSIEIPSGIAEAVLDKGEDLGVVIDRFAGRADVRSNEGTWGVLTYDLLTRGRSFETATMAALAPYYNSRAFIRP